MTIPANQSIKSGPFDGTSQGTTGPFTFTFTCFGTANVKVVKARKDRFEEEILPSTQYTVLLNQSQATNPGGTVTLTNALTDTFQLYILSANPFAQTLALTNQGAFYPAEITNTLDQIELQIKQIQEQLNRAWTAGVSDTTTYDLPRISVLYNFYNFYLGGHSTAPTIGRFNQPLKQGCLYYNTGDTKIYVWSGSLWVEAARPVSINPLPEVNNYNYLTTVPTTAFLAVYSPGNLRVFLDSVIIPVSDYTATDGRNVIFNNPVDTGTTVLITATGISQVSTFPDGRALKWNSTTQLHTPITSMILGEPIHETPSQTLVVSGSKGKDINGNLTNQVAIQDTSAADFRGGGLSLGTSKIVNGVTTYTELGTIESQKNTTLATDPDGRVNISARKGTTLNTGLTVLPEGYVSLPKQPLLIQKGGSVLSNNVFVFSGGGTMSEIRPANMYSTSTGYISIKASGTYKIVARLIFPQSVGVRLFSSLTGVIEGWTGTYIRFNVIYKATLDEAIHFFRNTGTAAPSYLSLYMCMIG